MLTDYNPDGPRPRIPRPIENPLPITCVNHKGETTARFVERTSPIGQMFSGTARVVTSTNHLGETTTYTRRGN